MEANNFVIGDMVQTPTGVTFAITKQEGEYFNVSRFYLDGKPYDKVLHRSELKPVHITTAFFQLIEFDVPPRTMYDKQIVTDKDKLISFVLYHGHLDLDSTIIHFVHNFQHAYKEKTGKNLDITRALTFSYNNP
ncbi:hypothetical protein [Pinibacter aurantiacus]|uniref:Uncharacterized protein n=1 Tax=Pinibacter aurantiacus TaxID=2851599 RepID=A0A9E2W1N3_9BACT|nr:hypothetical protein [Pinibacter aurantiacus]MBV4356295.1 hypothetical protein [Pinibacter aurantiacus]